MKKNNNKYYNKKKFQNNNIEEYSYTKFFRFSYSIKYLRYLTFFKNSRLSLYQSQFYNKIFIKYFWKNFYFLLIYFYLYKKKTNTLTNFKNFKIKKTLSNYKFSNFFFSQNNNLTFKYDFNDFHKKMLNQKQEWEKKIISTKIQKKLHFFYKKSKRKNLSLKHKKKYNIIYKNYIKNKNNWQLNLLKKKKFILNNYSKKVLFFKLLNFKKNYKKKQLYLNNLNLKIKKYFLVNNIVNLRKKKKKKFNYIIKNKKFYKKYFKNLKKKNKVISSWYLAKKQKKNKIFKFYKIKFFKQQKQKKKKFIKKKLKSFYKTKVFLFFFLISFFLKKKIKKLLLIYKKIYIFLEFYFSFYYNKKNLNKTNFIFLKNFFYNFKFFFKFFVYLKILFNSFIRYSLFLKYTLKFFTNQYFFNNTLTNLFYFKQYSFNNIKKQWYKKNYIFYVFFKFFFFKLWSQLGLIFQTLYKLFFFFNKFFIINFWKLKIIFFFKFVNINYFNFIFLRQYLYIHIKLMKKIIAKQYTEYKLNYYYIYIWLFNEKLKFFNNYQTFMFNHKRKNLLKKKLYNYNNLILKEINNKFWTLKLQYNDINFLRNFFFFNTYNNKFKIFANKINPNISYNLQLNQPVYKNYNIKKRYLFFRELFHTKKKSIIVLDDRLKKLRLDYFSVFYNENKKNLKNLPLYNISLSKKLKNKKKIKKIKKKIWYKSKKIFKLLKFAKLKHVKKKHATRKTKIKWRSFYSQLNNNMIKLQGWKLNRYFNFSRYFYKSFIKRKYKLKPKLRYKLNYDIPEHLEIDFKTLRIVFLSQVKEKNYYLPFHHKLNLLMTAYKNYGY